VTVSDGSAETSKSFVLTILPTAFAATNAWTNTAAIDVPGADFDNDGRLDLILTTPARNIPELYRNTATGFVPTRIIFPAIQAGGRMISADFNRDNQLDILIINSTRAVVFTNNGGTNFSEFLGHGLPRLEFPEINVADFDNDGDTDLAINGSANGATTFRLWYNENCVFRQVAGPVAGFSGSCRIADVDLDGWNDFLLVGTVQGKGETNGLYKATPDGSYIYEPVPAKLAGASNFGFIDINSDGRPDLWIETGGKLECYEYWPGGFELVRSLEGWLSGWGDLDNDGDLDLLARLISDRSDRAPKFSFREYQNEGDFSFTERGDPLFDAYPGGVQFADFNNDRSLDLIAGMRNALGQPAGARLYINKSTTLNSPPSAPRNLVAAVSNQVAHLSWLDASDLNQRFGLTYNVRIGTRPGSSDILAPLSLNSGKRLLPAIGNTAGRLSLLITNLTQEVYYWSVQAVDASFEGGPFAAEQRFIVETPGNEPPAIAAPVAVTSGEDTTGSLEITLNDDRTALEDLTMRVFPADPILLPLKNISVQGTGSVRRVSFLPATNAFGDTALSIFVADAVGSATTNIVLLSITNVNDAPRIFPITNQFSNIPREDIDLRVDVVDPDNSIAQFHFEVSSDNHSLVPPTNVTFYLTNAAWRATIRSATYLSGSANLTFTVLDPDLASSSTSFQVSFTNRVFRLVNQPVAGVRNGSMAWGDMDGDGDLDFALTGQGVTQTMFYRNRGNGTFESVPKGIAPVDGGGVEWGDYDNDGDLDLLVHGRDLAGHTFIARIYRNDGAGDLTQSQSFFGLYGPAAFGDYDRDGDLDVISTGSDLSDFTRTYLYRNDGDVFSLVSQDFGRSYGARWLDINLDGALDLQSSQMINFRTRDVLFVQQPGKFVLNATPPWPGTLLEWADLDLDGIPDAVANSFNNGSIGDLLILKNTNDLLSTYQILLEGCRQDGTALGDYDNDGFSDLFVSGIEQTFTYKTRLFRNQTDGTFQEVQTPLPNLISSTASWADIDNDGDLDLLINGQQPTPQSGYITQLFRNDYSPTNKQPGSPTNLQAFYTQEGLLLEWDAATDENQSGGLTYNVAIGTAPGKWDILAPMADASGWRMVPRPGNNGYLRWKLLTGIESGKRYYATVQAVDNAFAGSPFAPEVSITTGQPPRLDWNFEASIDEDESFEGEFQVSGGESTNYVLTASSSNPRLVPDSEVSFISREGRWFIKVIPSKGVSGTALITVIALDGQGGRATRSFTLTVNAINRPPVISSQTLALAEDSSIAFDFGASDPEGGALLVTNILRPRFGTLLSVNTGFIYQPLTNFFGLDKCIFVVSDDHGLTNSATITFEVEGIPDIAKPGFKMDFLFDETLIFNLVGEPYQSYQVEASTDLVNWSVLGVWKSPSGELPFTGARGTSQNMLFIRATLSE
jgi:hypothetical protein